MNYSAVVVQAEENAYHIMMNTCPTHLRHRHTSSCRASTPHNTGGGGGGGL